MTKTFTLAIAAIAATVLSTPAAAQELRSVEVDFADLNLASDVGVENFDKRIRMAIVRVCSIGATSDRIDSQWERRCERDTQARINPMRDERVQIARSGARDQMATLRIEAPALQR